mmetsp:Transcript_11684/g.26338  ORF Transcript_11684/g.26338 Transcript_11684/m.26338 type:complete len:89 (+) Transcript_11684:336-602(+)
MRPYLIRGYSGGRGSRGGTLGAKTNSCLRTVATVAFSTSAVAAFSPASTTRPANIAAIPASQQSFALSPLRLAEPMGQHQQHQHQQHY